MSNKNYTILHIHTMLSNGVTNIDSVTKYTDYIDKAKECGMKAMAMSEHGSIFSWINKKKYMESNGIKYIHAEEFYITETLDEKIRDNYHCLLIAKNYDGVLELNRLSSKAFNRDDNSYYYVPRISYEDLKNTSDNIIITTACLGGILSKGSKNLKNDFFRFILKNKHRCFFELQPHISKDQIEYNKTLYNIAKKYNIDLVMCTDTHALNEEHVKARAMLQKSKNIHFDGEDEFDLTFKTYDELVECCKKQNAIPLDDYLIAIENTNKIADMVEDFELDYTYKYPHLWGNNSEKIFKEKIAKGIKTRGVDKYSNYDEYIERIKYELKAYKHNQAIDFMLLMEDIINWCNENGIKVGYGRGSCNGSEIAYLLGITEMDSIKHGLNFDRFMSTERVSLSDIDTDFPPSRINEVKEYIFNKHGLYCSDIVTFNTIALKGAIRDIGRALEIPLNIVGDICNNVENNETQLREKYKELFEYVDMVNGTIVSVGNHPCGMIVSPHSVNDRLGTFTTSTDNVVISQVNMKEVDSLNYVKLDLLKLDTIELINKTCEMAHIERLTPDNIDINDVNVWNSMRDDTTQIFQWEGKTGNDYIKKLLSDENIAKLQKLDKNIDRMTLLSIGNSAIRPAGASYRDDLANGVIRKSGSKAIDDFLKPTFGYLVFQCQIIEFLHSYCGFTMGEADVVRRHFAKKYGTENDIPIIKYGGYINEKKDHYIEGFIKTMEKKYGMQKNEAESTIVAFLQVIEDASRYLFSLNHSQPYSYEGYVSAWLRYYYPLEFLTNALTINKDKENKTLNLIKYCKKVGIEIKSPKFRKSKSEYQCDKKENVIYKGIGSIKYMNDIIADELYELRNNSYKSFIDLLYDIDDKTTVNSKQLDILIKINYFSEFDSINNLLILNEIFKKYKKSKQIKKNNVPDDLLDIFIKNSNSETEKMIKDVNNKQLINELYLHYKKDNDNDILTTIKYQIELLGYSNLIDETCADNIYIVEQQENNNYGTPFCTLYRPCDGTSLQSVKIDKFWFQQYPCEVGDILKCSFDEKNKMRKIDGKWQEIDEIETILTVYSIM